MCETFQLETPWKTAPFEDQKCDGRILQKNLREVGCVDIMWLSIVSNGGPEISGAEVTRQLAILTMYVAVVVMFISSWDTF
jgi:hypothetical protein